MTFGAEDRPIDVSLQERALEIGADLMVMGAFGHTRLRDFVLGGATKGIRQGRPSADSAFALIETMTAGETPSGSKLPIVRRFKAGFAITVNR